MGVTASNGDKLICVQIMTKSAAQSVSGSDRNLPVTVQSHPASSSLPGLGSVVPEVGAGTLAVSFQDCGDASTDAVVKDVTPKTIAAGSTSTITGSGHLKKDIAGGSYTMTMTGVLSSVLVKNCNGDASKANTCDIVAPLLGKVGTLAYQPVTFPIKAGDISGVPKVAVTLKAGLPSSLETTTTTLKVTASNGDKLICVQIMTKSAVQSVSGSDMNLPVAVQSHPASSSLPGLASVVPQVEAGTLAVSFNDCGDASTDAVVKDVVPKTITAGATTTITGSGSLKKDIAGGSYDMKMTGVLSSVLVKNCNGDASKANTCDIIAPLLGKVGTLAYQPVTFPIKAGDISGVPKVAVTLKAGLPASLETTTTTLKVTASNGDKLICVQIMTKSAATSNLIVV